MRRNQPEPTEYKFVNDSAVAARIAIENGLIPIVDPTPGVHKKLIQAESDMAFLKSRAERYFMDVYVEWDRLHFQFPRPQTAAHVLEWGRNLSSFSPKISSAGLASIQFIRGYNQELAQTIVGMALALDFDPANFEERLGSSAMDLLTSLVRKGIRHNKVENPLDAVVVAKSMLANLLEGMYEGTGTCIGIPGPDRRQLHRHPRRRETIQRNIPGASGHPPHRRQRISYRVRNHPAQPRKPDEPAAQAHRRRAVTEQGRAILRRLGGDGRRQQRDDGRTTRNTDGPG